MNDVGGNFRRRYNQVLENRALESPPTQMLKFKGYDHILQNSLASLKPFTRL